MLSETLRRRLEPTGVGEYVRVATTSRLINASAPLRGRVIDLGGGEGNLGLYLRTDLRHAYTVVDREPGRAAYRIVADLDSLALAPNCADVVCVSDVLEHVPDDAALIREARRILRPGGILLVHVPSLRRCPVQFVARAIDHAEELSHQQFPHVREGYSERGLSSLLGGNATVLGSFTSFTSFISDLDLYLWTRRSHILRVPLWVLVRLAALSHQVVPRGSAGSGLIGISGKAYSGRAESGT